MSITEKTIKILWSNAAGRCSFTDCNELLTVQQAGASAPHTLGEMAHIKGKQKGSNRHDNKQNDLERDDYANLILLCPNHHTTIDKPENEIIFPTELLLAMKAQHEIRISECLTPAPIDTLDRLKDKLSIYLAENHQAWFLYGPQSNNAKLFPHNDEISAIWLSERLTTIVPNNRIMSKLTIQYRTFFPRAEQSTVSRFLSHVSSYEKWVHNEIPYQAIERFPQEFEHLIMEP
jgi:hypothetical protein